MDKQPNQDGNNQSARRPPGTPARPGKLAQTGAPAQPGRSNRRGQTAHPGQPAQRPPKNERGQVFTREELARYDGKEGRPAYVAYGGLVFDVSGSMRWRGGRHQDRHDAGRDLTREFKAAPHSTTILLRVPIVGKLVR